MTREAWKTGRGGSTTLPATGSKPNLMMLERRSELTYIICRPSRERLIDPLVREGVVTGTGSPRVRPLASSIATRHRFMDPPRSLAK
jgi:hypothetical protein